MADEMPKEMRDVLRDIEELSAEDLPPLPSIDVPSSAPADSASAQPFVMGDAEADDPNSGVNAPVVTQRKPSAQDVQVKFDDLTSDNSGGQSTEELLGDIKQLLTDLPNQLAIMLGVDE